MTQAAPTRRMTREEIIRLGKSGRAWAYLDVLAQVLRVAPDDAGLCLLGAANAAGLGLATLARDLLDRLPAEAGSMEEVRRLHVWIERAASDVIAPESRLETLERNLGALDARAREDVGRHVGAWVEETREWTWLRSNDGNVARWRGRFGEGEVRHLADQRSAARRFAREHFPRGDSRKTGPVTIEGADPAWVLLEVFRATEAGDPLGYRPRLRVVQADPMELLDGLACADCAEALGSGRVEVYVGPDASGALGRELEARFDEQIAGPVTALNSLRTPAHPRVEEVVSRAIEGQAAEVKRVRRRAGERYAGRDAAWWARRYEEALRGGGAPLRVLIPTTRYSVFLRHASHDLARAFEACGCEARVLIERDGCARLTPIALLREIERLEPDLIVQINYARADMDEGIPRSIPFVCWVQDAMGHQFLEKREGAGEFDFYAGHVHPELVADAGIREERIMRTAIGVSEAKFHDGPPASARTDTDCEVCFITHQSETPGALHERLKREADDAGAARVFDALRPEIEGIARDPLGDPPLRRLRAATARVVCAALGHEDERRTTLIHRQYSAPMADRILRHQCIEWAAEICERRGWRLALFGRGWEAHDRFARYARPALEHGEDLRTAYRRARVTVHASINTLLHQRVMECALSGGLPVCRLPGSEIRQAESFAVASVLERAEPDAACEAEGERYPGFSTADHAELMALESLRQRLGLGGRAVVPVRFAGHAKLVARRGCSAELLGDLASMTFHSPEGLEAILERAIEDPSWRAGWSGLIARRVRARHTHERFAREMIELVSRSLRASRAPAGRAVGASGYAGAAP